MIFLFMFLSVLSTRHSPLLTQFIAHLVSSVIYHADGNKEKAICGEKRQVLVEQKGQNQPKIDLYDATFSLDQSYRGPFDQ